MAMVFKRIDGEYSTTFVGKPYWRVFRSASAGQMCGVAFMPYDKSDNSISVSFTYDEIAALFKEMTDVANRGTEC